MKEAIIIDVNGIFQDVELVPDDVFGVFPIHETPETQEGEPLVEPPEPVLIGYRIAVPTPQGLYMPKYDIPAWQAAIEAYDAAYADYLGLAERFFKWRKQTKKLAN